MKSRTAPRTTRSHPFPSVPARRKAPKKVSEARRRGWRNTTPMSGTAATETRAQTREGKNPHAIPEFVAS